MTILNRVLCLFGFHDWGLTLVNTMYDESAAPGKHARPISTFHGKCRCCGAVDIFSGRSNG